MSCQSDVENFLIEGIVSDNETGLPLENVEISIICWYYGNSPDESYSGEDTKRVTTNENGEYEVKFDKGAYVEIKIDENGYAKVHETQYINSKNNTANIKLKPE